MPTSLWNDGWLAMSLEDQNKVTSAVKKNAGGYFGVACPEGGWTLRYDDSGEWTDESRRQHVHIAGELFRADAHICEWYPPIGQKKAPWPG